MNAAYAQYVQNDRKLLLLSILVFADETAALEFKNGELADNIKIDFPVISGVAGGQDIIMQKYCTSGFASPAFCLIEPDKSIYKDIEPNYYPIPELLQKYDSQIGVVTTMISDETPEGCGNPLVKFICLSNAIALHIIRSERYTISVFTPAGEKINLVTDEYLERGNRQVVWNKTVKANGIYLLTVNSDSFSAVRKVVLVR